MRLMCYYDVAVVRGGTNTQRPAGFPPFKRHRTAVPVRLRGIKMRAGDSRFTNRVGQSFARLPFRPRVIDQPILRKHTYLLSVFTAASSGVNWGSQRRCIATPEK